MRPSFSFEVWKLLTELNATFFVGVMAELKSSVSSKLGSKADLSKSKQSLLGSKNSLASNADLVKAKSLSKNNLAKAGSTRTSRTNVNQPEQRAVSFENTYRLKPETKFPTKVAHDIANGLLIKHLDKKKYDFETVPELCKTIGNELLQELKKLEYERYKIVIEVNIGEFKAQGIKIASRAVWDTTTDTYTSASFKNSSIFAVAMVFACYYE